MVKFNGAKIKEKFNQFRREQAEASLRRREFQMKVQEARQGKILKDVKSGRLVPKRNLLGGTTFETPQERRARMASRVAPQFDIVGIQTGAKKPRARIKRRKVSKQKLFIQTPFGLQEVRQPTKRRKKTRRRQPRNSFGSGDPLAGFI